MGNILLFWQRKHADGREGADIEPDKVVVVPKRKKKKRSDSFMACVSGRCMALNELLLVSSRHCSFELEVI